MQLIISTNVPFPITTMKNYCHLHFSEEFYSMYVTICDVFYFIGAYSIILCSIASGDKIYVYWVIEI